MLLDASLDSVVVVVVVFNDCRYLLYDLVCSSSKDFHPVLTHSLYIHEKWRVDGQRRKITADEPVLSKMFSLPPQNGDTLWLFPPREDHRRFG